MKSTYVFILLSCFAEVNNDLKNQNIDYIKSRLFYGTAIVLVISIAVCLLPSLGLLASAELYFVFGITFNIGAGLYLLIQMLFIFDSLHLTTRHLKTKLEKLREINELSLVAIEESYLKKLFIVTDTLRLFIYITFSFVILGFFLFGSIPYLLERVVFLNLFTCIIVPTGNYFTSNSLVYLSPFASPNQIIPTNIVSTEC